jgi:hypothetical protein
MVLLVGSAALAASALLPAPAAAAQPGSGPGSCYIYDNVANYPGACADQPTTFAESGVEIWNDPYHPTTVLGTGDSGQVFATHAYLFVSDGAAWPCESGVTTRFWYNGVHKDHGVEGWVPDCYLNGRPL